MMPAPGLTLFYGGLFWSKNVLATMMQSMFLMSAMSLLWFVCGYRLAFGDGTAFVGSLTQHLFLKGVGGTPNPDYAPTVPAQTFMLFQMMFAIIAPALITGAFAERIKFSAFLLRSVA
jgi:Amt family ammonium transporter